VIHQETLRIETSGRGTTDVTSRIDQVVRASGIQTGVAHLFLQHTSAALMVCENADPDVRRDLETIVGDLAPDGDARYRHTAEGPDDMAAHVRTLLTGVSQAIPVGGGRCLLGTWQGIYLWEHRRAGHQRQIIVTVQGE
jgi:secondary thiamine-phosphate synthase enzyme